MPVTVNINNLSLVHKGSTGISTATIPDVCKTPSPGGPVPIPYPNIAFSMDLMKGTTTVKADGGMMCANYGSEFFKSTGDEPGVVGGVVSNTFIKEATWITFSFDVKLQGKAACRLTDKMFHNHQNTVNMGGCKNPPVYTIGTQEWHEYCEKLAKEIDELLNNHTGHKQGQKGLKQKFYEQLGGKNGPPGSDKGDPGVWVRHDQNIEILQKKLRCKIKDFDFQKCNEGGHKIPSDAREWAWRPRPTPEDWKNWNEMESGRIEPSLGLEVLLFPARGAAALIGRTATAAARGLSNAARWVVGKLPELAPAGAAAAVP